MAVQGEDPVDVAQLEHAPDARLGAHNRELAVSLPHPLERADHHPDAERVDELDSRHVENQSYSTLRHRGDDLLTELGSARDVEITGHRDDRPRWTIVTVEHDMHD